MKAELEPEITATDVVADWGKFKLRVICESGGDASLGRVRIDRLKLFDKLLTGP